MFEQLRTALVDIFETKEDGLAKVNGYINIDFVKQFLIELAFLEGVTD